MDQNDSSAPRGTSPGGTDGRKCALCGWAEEGPCPEPWLVPIGYGPEDAIVWVCRVSTGPAAGCWLPTPQQLEDLMGQGARVLLNVAQASSLAHTGSN